MDRCTVVTNELCHLMERYTVVTNSNTLPILLNWRGVGRVIIYYHSVSVHYVIKFDGTKNVTRIVK